MGGADDVVETIRSAMPATDWPTITTTRSTTVPNRFKAEVFGQITDRSLSVWTSSGEAIVVEGKPHVRLSHGTIIPIDDRWSHTLAEAKHRAADELDEIAARITAKAAALRTEADATANPGSSS